MSGTKEGGIKTARTTKERYGDDFYIKAGSKGGQKTRDSGHLAKIGFGTRPHDAKKAGLRGWQARFKKMMVCVDCNKLMSKTSIYETHQSLGHKMRRARDD